MHELHISCKLSLQFDAILTGHGVCCAERRHSGSSTADRAFCQGRHLSQQQRHDGSTAGTAEHRCSPQGPLIPQFLCTGPGCSVTQPLHSAALQQRQTDCGQSRQILRQKSIQLLISRTPWLARLACRSAAKWSAHEYLTSSLMLAANLQPLRQPTLLASVPLAVMAQSGDR